VVEKSHHQPTDEPAADRGTGLDAASDSPVVDGSHQLAESTVEAVPVTVAESAVKPITEATTDANATDSKVAGQPKLPVDDTWSSEPDMTEPRTPPSAHSDQEAEEPESNDANAQEAADGETDGEKKLGDDAINHDELMEDVGDPSIFTAAANGFVMASSEGASAESDVLPDKIIAMQDDNPEGQTLQVVLDHAHSAHPGIDTHVNETFVPVVDVGQPELLKPADEPEEDEKPPPEAIIGSTPSFAEEGEPHAETLTTDIAVPPESEYPEASIASAEVTTPPTDDTGTRPVVEKSDTSANEAEPIPVVDSQPVDVEDDATAAAEEPVAVEPSTEASEPHQEEPTEVIG